MSGFLLDTNIISELIRPRPDAKVTAWLKGLDEDLLYLSVLTLGEIRKGVAALTDAGRRVSIEAWLEKDLRRRFEGRIIPVSEGVADRWGVIAGHAQKNKVLIPVIDGLLAATAIHHNLTLVTRNAKDVAMTGASVFNPFDML
ncbi:MAG: type II toxin-antitoxin system VapC family toxin [Candidatus Omnitrophota bacterium]